MNINEIVISIRSLPEEKLIAYGCITFGLILILLAILFW